VTLPAPLALVIDFVFALTAYGLVAYWYVAPALARVPLRSALPPLLLPHLMRPISLWLLVPGVIVLPSIPADFASGTAIGDLVATSLALVAAVLVRTEHKAGVAATWVFNVVGLADALRNCAAGMRMQSPPHMGAGVLIPAFGVPLLLVSHVLIFRVLIAHRRSGG
jgi:hypothetical protein